MNTGKGFSLVELLIAIVIVGILAGVSYSFFGDQVKSSNRTEAARRTQPNGRFTREVPQPVRTLRQRQLQHGGTGDLEIQHRIRLLRNFRRYPRAHQFRDSGHAARGADRRYRLRLADAQQHRTQKRFESRGVLVASRTVVTASLPGIDAVIIPASLFG